jgi:hypothetical protein
LILADEASAVVDSLGGHWIWTVRQVDVAVTRLSLATRVRSARSIVLSRGKVCGVAKHGITVAIERIVGVD